MQHFIVLLLKSFIKNTPHLIHEFYFPTGKVNVVEQLFKAGANVNIVNNKGYSILEELLEESMNIFNISNSNISIIIFDIFSHFISDDHTKGFCDDTKVDISDQEQCGLFLIDHGANVNGTSTEDKNTPLHLAILSGCNRIGESLIKAGANINAFSNASGWTPLHYAYPLPTNFEMPM